METTWKWQDRLGEHRARYYYVADRHTTPRLKRWHIATVWWAKAKTAYVRYHSQPPEPVGCVAAMQAYFPSSAWPEAMAIMSRESGYSPTAKNPSSSASGCFQLMSFWWDGSSAYGWVFDPFDAQQNAQHAYLMWRADGGSFCPGQWCLY